MKRRTATPEEIIAYKAFDIKRNLRVRYRHFVYETYNPRAKNGVSQRQYSRSRIRVVNGKSNVMHQGELHEITGDIYTPETGKPFVTMLRLNNPHLPR